MFDAIDEVPLPAVVANNRSALLHLDRRTMVGMEQGLPAVQLEYAWRSSYTVLSFLQPEQSGDRKPAAIGLQLRLLLAAPFGDRRPKRALLGARGSGNQDGHESDILLRL
jgi:hypothetical protein